MPVLLWMTDGGDQPRTINYCILAENEAKCMGERATAIANKPAVGAETPLGIPFSARAASFVACDACAL